MPQSYTQSCLGRILLVTSSAKSAFYAGVTTRERFRYDFFRSQSLGCVLLYYSYNQIIKNQYHKEVVIRFMMWLLLGILFIFVVCQKKKERNFPQQLKNTPRGFLKVRKNLRNFWCVLVLSLKKVIFASLINIYVFNKTRINPRFSWL